MSPNTSAARCQPGRTDALTDAVGGAIQVRRTWKSGGMARQEPPDQKKWFQVTHSSACPPAGMHGPNTADENVRLCSLRSSYRGLAGTNQCSGSGLQPFPLKPAPRYDLSLAPSDCPLPDRLSEVTVPGLYLRHHTGPATSPFGPGLRSSCRLHPAGGTSTPTTRCLRRIRRSRHLSKPRFSSGLASLRIIARPGSMFEKLASTKTRCPSLPGGSPF